MVYILEAHKRQEAKSEAQIKFIGAYAGAQGESMVRGVLQRAPRGRDGGGEEPLETLHRSEWGRAWSQLGRSSPFFLIMVLVQMKSTPRFWCTLGRPKMTVLLITSSQGGRTAVNSVVCACGCREVLRLQSFSFPPPKASELGGGQPRPFSCSFRYLKCALERPLVNMYALKPYCWTK